MPIPTISRQIEKETLSEHVCLRRKLGESTEHQGAGGIAPFPKRHVLLSPSDLPDNRGWKRERPDSVPSPVQLVVLSLV
jgi:hypothetical protein